MATELRDYQTSDIIGAGAQFSQEAEGAVLGGMLFDPKCIDTVAELIKSPDSFYRPQHQALFSIIMRLYSVGKADDIVTIIDESVKAGVFSDSQMARTYLMGLVQNVSSVANIDRHCEIINEKALIRKLVDVSEYAIKTASENAVSADNLLDDVEQKIYNIRQGKNFEGLSHISEVVVGVRDNISKNEIIYNVKPRELIESSIRKAIKRKKDNDPDESEIKEEDNHINIKTNPQPYFGNIRSSMYRLINKNIPKDIENLNELPDDSEYYKTLSGEQFLFYKTDHLLIFMSPNQANLLYEYNQHVFIDGTFYAAPKCSYQIVTLRIHNIKEDLFHTIAYGILIGKSLNSYIEFLDNIKMYSFNNRENKRDMNQREPLNIHCNF